MLPKELGGVVDANLVVYGTENVRVVDASVLPGQISGHLTSLIYAVSERAGLLNAARKRNCSGAPPVERRDGVATKDRKSVV